MSFAARLAALAFLLVPLSASAEEAVIRWGDAEIPYDPAIWRPAGPAEAGVVSLICVAADCPEGARIYATITAPNGGAEQEPWRGPEAIALQAPALPFLAYRLWSGCRALDNPILSAAIVFRGRLYRVASALGEGCNREPDLPLQRFTDLIEAIRPADEAR